MLPRSRSPVMNSEAVSLMPLVHSGIARLCILLLPARRHCLFMPFSLMLPGSRLALTVVRVVCFALPGTLEASCQRRP